MPCKDFAKVLIIFDGKFSRQELEEFDKKYSAFDEDGNGFIDFFELKRAQEKLNSIKSHLQLKEMMQQMASDPEKGISFSDFVAVQWRVRGGTKEDLRSLPSGDIPPPTSPLEEAFVKSVKAFDVKGIKQLHEVKAQFQTQEKEREKAIKDGAETRKLIKQKEKEEKDRAMRQKREADEKRQTDRATFKAKFSHFDQN